MAKKWSKTEKIKIIEFNENHSALKTCQKFNINLSTLKRWKREIRKLGEESLEWGNGSNSKNYQKKRFKKSKNEIINYKNMSRNKLIERAKFGDALKKYSIKSIKDKFLIIDSLKADFTIRFLCEVMNVSRYGYYKWKNNGSKIYNKWNDDLASKINNIYYGFNKVYGYNMISLLLWKIHKINIEAHVVYRYMKNMKIKAVRKKRSFKYKIEIGEF